MPTGRKNARSIQTHQFDPFLEISHRCRLTVHFNTIPNYVAKPIVLDFPIIITDYPSVISDSVLSLASSHIISTETTVNSGGDDAVPVDLDLPEYTPRYEEAVTNIPSPLVIIN